MPFFVIPFPQIDPVLVEFGPFAIRWYALAYIAGLLIGWRLALAIVSSDHLWGSRIHPDRLTIDDQQHWRERWNDPQGVGLANVPSCFTSVPLTVFWGQQETKMKLIGGLLGVSQNDDTLEVEPQCGWVVAYEEPVDPLSDYYKWIEDRKVTE